MDLNRTTKEQKSSEKFPIPAIKTRQKINRVSQIDVKRLEIHYYFVCTKNTILDFTRLSSSAGEFLVVLFLEPGHLPA